MVRYQAGCATFVGAPVSGVAAKAVVATRFISYFRRKGMKWPMNDSESADGLMEKVIDAIDDELAGLPLRDTTRHMIANMFLGLPLTPAQKDDFGVYTPDHYRAIRAVLEPTPGRTMHDAAIELDGCLGKGPALNALVRKVAPQYADVHFATVWDRLRFT